LLHAIGPECREQSLARLDGRYKPEELITELTKVSNVRDMDAAEQSSCGVVPQDDGIVVVNGDERDWHVFEQRLQVTQFGFVLFTVIAKAVEYDRECLAEILEPGAQLSELESLTEIRVTCGVEKTGKFLVCPGNESVNLVRDSPAPK
jgi:hypothetical protein